MGQEPDKLPFLKVSLCKGMLPSEHGIIFILADGFEASAFVNKDAVYENRLCKIRIMGEDKKGVWVRLPAPILDEHPEFIAGRHAFVSPNQIEWHR